MGKKVIWGLLLSAVVFLSAACGKEGTSELEAQWNRENRLLDDLPVEQGNLVYTDIVMAEGWAAWQYAETDEEGKNLSGIRLCSLTDKAVRDYFPSFQPGDYLLKYTLDGNGGIYAVLTSGSAGGSDGQGSLEYFLAAFDADGRERFRRNITAQAGEDPTGMVGGISVDGQGRLYVSGSSEIWLYSASGEYCGTVELDGQNYRSFCFAGTDREGEMYVAGRGRAGYELAEIDFDGKKVGSVSGNLKIGNGACVFGKGMEKDFLVSDGSFVYEYDLQSRSLVKLFQWMDFDINGADVQSLGAAPGGIAAAAGKDPASGENFLARFSDRTAAASGGNPSGPAPGEASDAPPKKRELVLATLSLENDSTLKSAVVSFNKASESWHITIKEYGKPSKNIGERYERWTMDAWSDAVARLNADLVSENCPDIVDLTDLNIAELAKKGVFLDLSPFLEGSDVLSESDYPENILDACTYQGSLLGIPKIYSVTSVMAHASDVGTEQGWTLDELMAYAAAHPDAELFENATKSEIMNYCMSFYESGFVDLASGECRFDSPEFKKLLEFVRSFPDEKEKAVGTFVSPPVKISNRDVLLEKVTLLAFFSIQYQDAVFENDGVWIGFPTPDKTPGHALHLSSVYAITSRSAAAEGAWEFIEGYLAEEPDVRLGYFPSSRQALQKRTDTLLQGEYLKDSQGNLILDEEGQPYRTDPIASGTFSYTDGWSYKYHIETPEEVEQALELLNAARRSDTYNGNGIIMMIISEEAEAFYSGQKSLDATAETIQRRVRNYIDENR